MPSASSPAVIRGSTERAAASSCGSSGKDRQVRGRDEAGDDAKTPNLDESPIFADCSLDLVGAQGLHSGDHGVGSSPRWSVTDPAGGSGLRERPRRQPFRKVVALEAKRDDLLAIDVHSEIVTLSGVRMCLPAATIQADQLL